MTRVAGLTELTSPSPVSSPSARQTGRPTPRSPGARFRQRRESLFGVAKGSAGGMTRSQRFLGLNAARILASFHIVVGHLYQKSGVLGLTLSLTLTPTLGLALSLAPTPTLTLTLAPTLTLTLTLTR